MYEKISIEEIRNALITLQRVCMGAVGVVGPLFLAGECMGERAPEEWNINDPDDWQAFRY